MQQNFFSTCINFFISVLTQIADISKTPQESCVKTLGFMGLINNQAFFTLGLVYIFLKSQPLHSYESFFICTVFLCEN